MAQPPLADAIRARPVVSSRQAGQLLGLTDRTVRRLFHDGHLAATRHGPAGRSVLEYDTADVLALALARLRDDDGDVDQDDDPNPLQPSLDDMEDRRSA